MQLEDIHRRFVNDFDDIKDEIDQQQAIIEDKNHELRTKSNKISKLMMRIVCCMGEIERLRAALG